MGVNIKHYGIMGKSKIRQLLQAGYADVPRIYKKEIRGKMWNQDFLHKIPKKQYSRKVGKIAMKMSYIWTTILFV